MLQQQKQHNNITKMFVYWEKGDKFKIPEFTEIFSYQSFISHVQWVSAKNTTDVVLQRIKEGRDIM